MVAQEIGLKLRTQLIAGMYIVSLISFWILSYYRKDFYPEQSQLLGVFFFHTFICLSSILTFEIRDRHEVVNNSDSISLSEFILDKCRNGEFEDIANER